MTSDFAGAQEAANKKAKSVKKGEYAPASKNVPVAKSLTNGQKVGEVELTRIIDQEINKRIKAEGAKSAGQCDDAEFVRRVYLDLAGTIPTASRVTAFLNSKETDKRAKLIDELLADKRFGTNLAEIWSNQMIPHESNNRFLQQKPFESWLAGQFNNNVSLDKTVYELITASGEIDKNPAITYFVANPTVDKMTDSVARMFLGVQLQCAQCHNHPFTDWKQTEYWAMAAFFMKTKMSATPQAAAKKGATLAVSETGKSSGKKQMLPESAKLVPAKFLQGEQPKITTPELRPTLAKWMTSADNKYFARAMANRFWYELFGRGLVNPVDDMHDDNAPSHPELLATLTEQFKLNGFDAKYLIRSICNSDVYQRTSASKMDVASVEPDLYVRREMRVMRPENMYDSLATILGGESGRGTKAATGKRGPTTSRDVFVAFYRVEDANPIEYQIGIPQALRMMNSSFTGKGDGTAMEITKNSKTPTEAIERIYLTTLSRMPTAQEVERLTAYLRRDNNQRNAYGDILWALMNSSEFVLNH
jgi:hypothetical protein